MPLDKLPPQALEHLFKDRALSRLPLPPLKDDPSWFERAWERFVGIVQSFFGSYSGAMGFSWFAILVKIGLAVTVLLTLGWTVFALIRVTVRKFRGEIPESSPTDNPARDSFVGMETQLGEAISMADIPRAARLRWRLFQHRTRLGDAVTPAEFDSNGPWVLAAYGLMFESSRSRNLEAFREFDSHLEGIERLETMEGLGRSDV